MKRAIVWLRQDLRLSDNAALSYACLECDEVFPVFIETPDEQSISNIGSASRAWLHQSLQALMTDLTSRKSALIIRKGAALDVLQQLIAETNATHIFWNRCYEPAIQQRDVVIKETLKQQLEVKSFRGNLLDEPWRILKGDGTPYRVFTPYWKSLQAQLVVNKPLTIPESLKPATNWPSSLAIDDLDLLPVPPIPRWDKNIMQHWQVGESAAHNTLHNFLQDEVKDYKEQRDFPAIKGTSLLSPHLHFGEISPLQIFNTAYAHKAENPHHDFGVGHLLREVAWREFAYYLLYHFPQTLSQPLYEKFSEFAWRNNEDDLKRWQQGMTGFPLIDAGMRELWHTGWMHNRVRMIVASFLCKNLLIHWRSGEAWFRDTLVDADIASNTMGWQWVAGSGADAAPYFRIFNPVLQSKKFDKDGEYIRKWVPELSQLDNKQIHEPTAEQAQQCGYPEAMVDLKATRERALERYSRIR